MGKINLSKEDYSALLSVLTAWKKQSETVGYRNSKYIYVSNNTLLFTDGWYAVSVPVKSIADRAYDTNYSQWTFIGMLDLSEYVNSKETFTVKIPKGNDSGLFSSWAGGGSILECKLQNDLALKIGQYGETCYDRIDIVLSKGKYDVQSVYGCDERIFGNEISVH